MKVLILSHSSDLAGAEKSMLRLFDYWGQTTDIEPEFIIRKPLLKLTGELKKRGQKYHAIYYTNWAQRNPASDSLNIYWLAKQNTKAVAKIEKIIQAIKPDLVMTNTIVAPWAAIAAYNQAIPHVWFIREFGEADHGFVFRLGQAKTFDSIGKLSKLVVANSGALKKFAAKYIDESKITILYPSLDFDEVDQLSKTKVANPFKYEDSLKLVITGRIAPAKGQALVAEAVGLLNKQGINCELLVIGSPSDEADSTSLLSAIRKYNLADKVHAVGHQKNPLPYVALADIGIMASDSEAFGRVTLEYMALGKAVIGANAGATPELIEPDKNGYLFKPGDPQDLAKMLTRYAKNKQLIARHGQAAKQRAHSLINEKHTADQLYKKLSVLADDSIVGKHSGSKEEVWQQYPILLAPSTKKPTPSNTAHYLIVSVKHILKTIYLHLR